MELIATLVQVGWPIALPVLLTMPVLHVRQTLTLMRLPIAQCVSLLVQLVHQVLLA